MKNEAQAKEVGAPRVTHVQSQMERQGGLIQKLTKEVERLEIRLQPILQETSPMSDSDDPTKEKAVLVSHAIAIQNQNNQLENLLRQVCNITDRIEL
jgi:hypothetical protein